LNEASQDSYKPLPTPYFDRLLKHVYYSLKNDPALSRDLAKHYGLSSSNTTDGEDYQNKSPNIVRRSTSLMATGSGIMNQKQLYANS
jgi:hypothetical protein